MDGEIWKPVKGWEGYYEISNMGRARSVTRQADVYVRGNLQVRTHHGKMLSLPVGKNGYVCLSFTAPGGIREYKLVHQLVAEHFLPEKNPGDEVCHKDGNRTNNTVSNLRYGSRSSNALDRHEHGTMNQARGTDHAFHKLTEEDVRWIRANEGTMSQREMADVFGVCHSTIGNVQRRKQWAHV